MAEVVETIGGEPPHPPMVLASGTRTSDSLRQMGLVIIKLRVLTSRRSNGWMFVLSWRNLRVHRGSSECSGHRCCRQPHAFAPQW